MKRNKIKYLLAICLPVVLALTGVFIGIAVAGNQRAAGGSITITYEAGSYGDGTPTNLFVSFAETDTLTESQCLILPGPTFGVNVNGQTLTHQGSLDSETFYFDAEVEGTDRWAYSFTGWKIKGAEDKIPGKTVFQPGDVITPEVLNGATSITLEALWGKCYFIRNPYDEMNYTTAVFTSASGTEPKNLYTLQIPTDKTALSSDTNLGNDKESPKATIDSLYESIRLELGNNRTHPLVHDAYSRVVMLVGELDYYTDSNQHQTKVFGYASYGADKRALPKIDASNVVPVAATFKSLGENPYTLNYKPKSYSNYSYGNFRFDNVNFCIKKEKWNEQDNGVEFPITTEIGNASSEDSYFELTARFNASMPSGRSSAISTFRPQDTTYVVVNGGSLSGMQNQYSSGIKTGKQLYWYIGRNASIGSLNCGTTSAYTTAYHNLYYNFKVYIVGGTITDVHGGSNGINSISAGKREFYLYGDGTENRAGPADPNEYDPKITNFYGGSSEARLFGDISIKADGCTKLQNMYGGGEDYTAVTYGNIKIELKNCVISGNLFGGGRYGNCEVTPATYMQYSNNYEDGFEQSVSLLDAALDNNFKIDNKTLAQRQADNIGGDVTIVLNGTHVMGNVYGSGMGETQVIEVRNQMSILNEWFRSEYTDSEGNITERIYPDVNSSDMGGVPWTQPIQGYPAYNSTDNRVWVNAWRDGTYTTNAIDTMSYYNWRAYAYLSLATVRNVDISIIEQSEIGTSSNNGKGNVYGGGSIAKVLGDTKITVDDSTVWGNVYGGGDGVTVPSKVKLFWPEDHAIYSEGGALSGKGIVYQHPYYSGKHGEITWTKQVPNPDNRNKDTGYKGYLEYTWSNGADLQAVGIDHENRLLYSPNTEGLGSVEGNTSVHVTGTTIVHGDVFGGGNEGVVFGNTSVVIEAEERADGNANVQGSVFGGGNKADVKALKDENGTPVNGSDNKPLEGNVSLIIKSGIVNNAYGGNNLSGSIEGQIRAELTGTGHIVNSIFGGGNKAAYAGITNFVISGGTVGDYDSEQNEGQTVTGTAYGGGREASVYGANTTISGGTIRAFIGGSLSADIINPGNDSILEQEDKADAIRVFITGASPTKIKTFLGGNDQSGTVEGNIRIVVGLSEDNLFLTDTEGNQTINYKAACANTQIDIRNFFGGGNQAGYTYGENWVPPAEDTIEDGRPAPNFEGITITIAGGTIYQAFGGGVMASITNVRIAIYGGEYHFMYGGGFQGESKNCVTHVRGGTFTGDMLVYGQDTLPTDAQGGYIFGGGYDGYTENSIVHIEEYEDCKVSIAHSVFAGGNQAGVANPKIVVKSGTIVGSVYGGGFEGDAGYNSAGQHVGHTMVILNGGSIGMTEQTGGSGTYVGNVYGGGYRGKTAETYVKIIEMDENGLEVPFSLGGNIYGGGHEANVENDTHIHFLFGTIKGNIYGGGRNGNVLGSTYVDFLTGKLEGNLYAGGYMGTVNNTYLLITDDLDAVHEIVDADEELRKSVATLENLTPENLHIEIGVAESDSVNASNSATSGNVFGGGEGLDATVYASTTVRINTINAMAVSVEPKPAEDGISSGESIVTVNLTQQTDGYDCSVIRGNVYGGGDHGRIGVGTINQSNNTAAITREGSTTVTVENGRIFGSVFGGGSGVPKTGDSYNINMGAVFGSTTTTISGGYIKGNVYGGGTQSRLFAPVGKPAATVSIQEKDVAEGQESLHIVIEGSIFGGGDRGTKDALNASIPTTVGNVSVTIQGKTPSPDATDTGSNIHIMWGGVYGDGNLCLVNGRRTISLIDFNTGNDEYLKTFYSLQRADEVILSNSDIVLHGAIDLVEEGDDTTYSINRISALRLQNGSTFKLEKIVKYLGELTSDIEYDRVFIDKGNNGNNNYTAGGGTDPTGQLQENDPQKYINGEFVESTPNDVAPIAEGTPDNEVTDARKNVVCVANGLYLEIKKSDGSYGAVKGLFTLQLLYAVPGEGGGFVYSDIASSTGDFICETVKEPLYKPVPADATFDPEETYYICNVTKGYVPVKITAFDPNTIYYTAEDTYVPVAADAPFFENETYYIKDGDTYVKQENLTGFEEGTEYYIVGYMMVQDNVTAYVGDDPTCFYWFIDGSTVQNMGTITGYISSETVFNMTKPYTVPTHTAELEYTLFGVEGDSEFKRVLNDDVYTLVQSAENLHEKQIALELKLGDVSLGFLFYDSVNDKWMIEKDNTQYEGYFGDTTGQGDQNPQNQNTLLRTTVDSNHNELRVVLYKSPDVSQETKNMVFTVTLDLFFASEPGVPDSSTPYDGTKKMIFTTSVNIIKYVPEQSMYLEPGKLYAGVDEIKPIAITGASAFSVEYQTKYIPSTYPITGTERMTWSLSTKPNRYYFDDTYGIYMTLAPDDDTVLNISANYSLGSDVDGKNPITYDADSRRYSFSYSTGDGSHVQVWLEHLNSQVNVQAFPIGTEITMIDYTNSDQPSVYFYRVSEEDVFEIELTEFKKMGGEGVADSEVPYFMKAYEDRSGDRVTERLVFVFDMEDVTYDEALTDFASNVSLCHTYDDKDIMDFVKTTESGATISHQRSSPEHADFTLYPDDPGVTVSIAISNDGEDDSDSPSLYMKDTFSLTVTVTKSETALNTIFERYATDYLDGGYAVLLEMKQDGTPIQFPTGTKFYCGDAIYGEGVDQTYAVIPLGGDAGIYQIKAEYLIQDMIVQPETPVTLYATILSAPVAEFCRLYEVQAAQDLIFTPRSNENYALSVINLSSRTFQPGDEVSFDLEKSGSSNPVNVELKRVESNGQQTSVVLTTLFETPSGPSDYNNPQNLLNADGEYSWDLKSTVPAGVYKLYFIYGNCMEYIDILVQ